MHPGSADFGAPGYPDPERSSAMAASLQSPHGESHQTAPTQGGAEMPPTERPVEAQAKGEAQAGAQAHPDPEHSAAAVAQTSEPKGHAQEPAAQGHAPPNQAPETKGASHETAPAQGHAESAGQGQSNHKPQGQPDHQAHQTEVRGEASFGAHNYPTPEREPHTAASLSSPGGGGGQGAAEHSSATYNVSNGAQPREMPPPSTPRRRSRTHSSPPAAKRPRPRALTPAPRAGGGCRRRVAGVALQPSYNGYDTRRAGYDVSSRPFVCTSVYDDSLVASGYSVPPSRGPGPARPMPRLHGGWSGSWPSLDTPAVR